jgi:D-Tyr-tRNAtyr deacylase
VRALIQRVKKGSVEVDNKIISTIDQGIVLFIGIENARSVGLNVTLKF